MTQELSDLELIENVQSDVDVQESLTQLINRHSGIYLDMVNVSIYFETSNTWTYDYRWLHAKGEVCISRS